MIGTIETRIGDTVLPSERTTPEATDLHALLAIMVERGVDAVAMEVSSHALALGRVGGVVFDVALFTNLGSDHLDFHDGIEDYFGAKARLFTPEHTRTAVVNLDDPYGRRLVERAAVPTTTFAGSGDRAADWWAEDVVTGPTGSTFNAIGPGGVSVACSVALSGRFNVDNALGALADARERRRAARRRGHRRCGVRGRSGAGRADRWRPAVPRARRLCPHPRGSGNAPRGGPAAGPWPARGRARVRR